MPENNVALTVPFTFNLLFKFVEVPIPIFPLAAIIILNVVADDPDEV